MKAKIPFKATNPKTASAIEAEIKQQCVAINADYELELDALVLWTMHEQYGWGRTRLLRFYEHILALRKEMHDYYTSGTPNEKDAGIEYVAAKLKLHDLGIDLDTEFKLLDKKYHV